MNNFLTKIFTLVLSLGIHTALFINSDDIKDQKDITKPHRFRITKLKTVGSQNSKKKSISLPSTKKNNKKLLSLADLEVPQTKIEKKKVRGQNFKGLSLTRPSAIKSLKLNKQNIKDFLRHSPNFDSSKKALDSFKNTDVAVKLELPNGVKEDELNKKELVFYSFQKRTAMAYINSFQKELNEFGRKNPHLRFPLTDNKEKMTGRITYDKDGNILKIQTVRWSQITKLQDFFMEVLQNMSSLPNPPKEITGGDQFSVFFSFTINNG